MDYEKAYNEALERAKKLKSLLYRDAAEIIFPVLKESEDEKIKSQIMSLVNFHMGADYSPEWKQKCLDWLKRQKEVSKSPACTEDDGIRGAIIDYLKDNNLAEWADWLEKQSVAEPSVSAWSAEDEKVLHNACEFIRHRLKGYPNSDNIQGMTYYELYNKLKDIKDRRVSCQKMHWSKEDDTFLETALWHVSNSISNGKETDLRCDTTVWLKSLKNRILPQPKQEWSEEDEKNMETLINVLYAGTDLAYEREINWLKFLKDKYTWKPSDEQMKAIGIAIQSGIQLGTWEEDALKSLADQLKKLREG